MEIIEENLTSAQPSPSSLPVKNKRKKFLLVVFIIPLFVFVVLLLIFFFTFIKQPPKPILPSPSPTLEATPSSKRVLSSIATESGFLKLENDLKLFEKDTIEVDLSEPKLSPPILELSVTFEK